MMLRTLLGAVAGLLLLHGTTGGTSAQESAPGLQPTVGQAGKDVVWVPTPPPLVEEMLTLAGVTDTDFVVDLGSGDGRNVIAAAKRGAKGLGVEYNAELVALSRKAAAEAGVSDLATFVQGDMYEADVSAATVLTLFLIPENLEKLRPTFLALKPGTRIVSNTFGIGDWPPDQEVGLPACNSWCTALLWVVPARLQGTWKTPDATLELKQSYQTITGEMTSGTTKIPVERGHVRGSEITFAAGGSTYEGRLVDGRIEGTVTAGQSRSWWMAEQARP